MKAVHELFERSTLPVVEVVEFIQRVRESGARAEEERRQSEAAILEMKRNPPFESDWFPGTIPADEKRTT